MKPYYPTDKNPYGWWKIIANNVDYTLLDGAEISIRSSGWKAFFRNRRAMEMKQDDGPGRPADSMVFFSDGWIRASIPADGKAGHFRYLDIGIVLSGQCRWRYSVPRSGGQDKNGVRNLHILMVLAKDKDVDS